MNLERYIDVAKISYIGTSFFIIDGVKVIYDNHEVSREEVQSYWLNYQNDLQKSSERRR